MRPKGRRSAQEPTMENWLEIVTYLRQYVGVKYSKELAHDVRTEILFATNSDSCLDYRANQPEFP